MPVGSAAKTAFEKALPSHEHLLKSLSQLFKSKPNKSWNFCVGVQQTSILAEQSGKALSSRLKLGGKLRRTCLPSNSTSAFNILKYIPQPSIDIQKGSPEILVTTDEAPTSTEIAQWAEKIDHINKVASAFGGSINITNESLSKEILRILEAPALSSANQALFLHDGVLGSGADGINFSVVTHDASAALFLKNMLSPASQVSPSSFSHSFSVFYVPDFQLPSPLVIEEFGGVSAEDMGITSSHFALFNLKTRTCYVSGTHKTLQNAILCLGNLAGFHASGQIILQGDSFINDGKLIVLIGNKDSSLLRSPKLYGAHHQLWGARGVSRLWNGITVEGSDLHPEYTTDLLVKTESGSRLTCPLPLQIGGVTRARGSNQKIGDKSETDDLLVLQRGKPWRPSSITAENVTMVFVGEGERDLSAKDAADLYAKTQVGYPLGAATKQLMAESFEELAKESKVKFMSRPAEQAKRLI
jgi:hypothetical protein